MNAQDRQKLLQRLTLVSPLPPDAPERLDVERLVAAQNGSPGDHWCDDRRQELELENEAFRVALHQQPSAPLGMQQRLLALTTDIAKDSSIGTRVNSAPAKENATALVARRGILNRRKTWALAIVTAALVVLAVDLGLSLRQASRRGQVANLAFELHQNDQHLSVETSDCRVLARTLDSQLPFKVTLPQLKAPARLIGGRKCKLGTHPVVYSLWNTTSGEVSLFQFDPHDFGLSSNTSSPHVGHFHVHTVAARTLSDKTETFATRLWTDQGRGYILVGGDGVELLEMSTAKLSPIQSRHKHPDGVR